MGNIVDIHVKMSQLYIEGDNRRHIVDVHVKTQWTL